MDQRTSFIIEYQASLKCAFFGLSIALIAIAPTPLQAKTSNNSKIESFAYSAAWLNSMHYGESGQGYISRIDDPRYFFSESGRQDPLAELKALIKAVQTDSQQHDKPAKCSVPFRYRIVSEAGFVKPDSRECPELEFYKNELGVDDLSIVHVAQYADNPSSILGHLFLQFHNANRNVGEDGPNYLNKTVNYAAGVPPETGALNFMASGIFGGFKGRYTLYQFADMMGKYNDAESRDLFVYKLNFTAAEIEKVMEHVWELTNFATQDYFFFDENCAFQILAIMEAVKPDLHLTAQLPVYTTPIDVLKISSNEGLIKSIDYLPSLYQRYSDKLVAMNSAEHHDFKMFLNSELMANKIPSKLTVEALIDHHNFLENEKQGDVSKDFIGRRNELLSHRSTLGTIAPKVRATNKTSPHLSHGAARISIGGGNSDGATFQSVRFRPAIHDLLSRQDGFQRNSSLSFLTIEVKKNQYTPGLLLSEIQLFSISKLFGTSSQNRLAWDFDFKFTEDQYICSKCLSPDFALLIGISKSLLPDLFDLFFMAKATYDPRVLGEFWGGGIGFSTGISLTPALTRTKKIRIIANGSRSMNLSKRILAEIDAGLGFDLSTNIDFRILYTSQKIMKTKAHKLSANVGYSF